MIIVILIVITSLIFIIITIIDDDYYRSCYNNNNINTGNTDNYGNSNNKENCTYDTDKSRNDDDNDINKDNRIRYLLNEASTNLPLIVNTKEMLTQFLGIEIPNKNPSLLWHISLLCNLRERMLRSINSERLLWWRSEDGGRAFCRWREGKPFPTIVKNWQTVSTGIMMYVTR